MKTWTEFQDRLAPLARQWPQHVSELVDTILAQAVQAGASDVHFDPTHSALQIRMRMDGVLQSVARLPKELSGNVIARLKVTADLLTYRLDVPQEGRARLEGTSAVEGDRGRGAAPVDLRVSTFPTIHGERAVVRLFDPEARSFELDELGLGTDVRQRLERVLADTSGILLLTGPSGSGKTTTIYACLSHLVRASGGGRHMVTLEDPVEVALEGISQSQVAPAAGFDFARGMRSLLRQDPEVIMIGEIRDRETAEIAVEAGLTGHLVISTLHAGSACGVVGRLLEMGIEPYLLTSSLKAVVNQRLVRCLCTACAGPAEIRDQESAGSLRQAVGCAQCLGTGYRGRKLLAEMLEVDAALRRAILDRYDTSQLEQLAREQRQATLWDAARNALTHGEVSMAEVQRVMGREHTVPAVGPADNTQR
jgi:general secretion pathway protein E